MTERRKKRTKKILITIVILMIALDIFSNIITEKPEEKEGSVHLIEAVCQAVGRQMQRTCFILPVFLEEERISGNLPDIVLSEMENNFLIYGYVTRESEEENAKEDSEQDMMQIKEGSDEDRKDIAEDNLDYDENALHIEKNILEELQKENNKFVEENKKGQEVKSEEMNPEEQQEVSGEEQIDFQVPPYPAYTYDWSENWGYEEIISNFYAVDNTTSLEQEYVSLDKLLYRDLSIEKTQETDAPQILIYHTHSQEGFVDSVPGDTSTTIVGAGAKLADLLENLYGFKVLHHTGEYDVENRDYAYSNSLPAIEQLLLENPSIEVIIDLHRDAVNEENKLVMDLNGRPTARFMFFNGMSYIRDKGNISYLENPYIEDNLALSFQAQVAANEYYPGIARKIYLKAYRYNMHLRPKSMLIELGAQTNTVEEIMNACDPLAHIIAIVLDKNL